MDATRIRLLVFQIMWVLRTPFVGDPGSAGMHLGSVDALRNSMRAGWPGLTHARVRKAAALRCGLAG